MDTANKENDFSSLLEQGEEAARQHEYEKARDLLNRALDLNPSSVRAIRAIAALHLAESRVKQARACFEKAFALDPQDPKTLSGMGMCEMLEDKPEQAYTYFLEALKINPYQLVTILQLLECSYRLNRFHDLEKVLRSYTLQFPEDMEMKFCLAGCLYKMRNTEEAREIVQCILQSNPNHLGSTQLLQILEEEAKEIQQPVEPAGRQQIARPAAANHSDVDEVDCRLDMLEEEKRLRNFDKVKQGCDEILAQESIRGDQAERANLLRAETLLLEGNFEESRSIYDLILTKNPRSARAQCGLGAMAANDGRWDMARNHFRYAHELFPDYDVPLAGLGLCCMQRQDNEGAWVYFTRALKINCENTRALLGMIELGYSLNRLSEVEAAIRNYLELHPGDINFLYSLAGCFFAQRRLDEAKGELEKVIALDPANERANELMEVIDKRAEVREACFQS